VGYYERVELEIMRKRLEKMREELLRKTYFKIHSDPNLRVLKDTVEYVLNKMRTNIDYVFCTVLLAEVAFPHPLRCESWALLHSAYHLQILFF